MTSVFASGPEAQAKRVMYAGHAGIWLVSSASSMIVFSTLGSVYQGFFASEWVRLFVSTSFFFFMLAFYYGLQLFLNNVIFFSATFGTPNRWPRLEALVNLGGLFFTVFVLFVGITIGINLLRFQAKLTRAKNAIQVASLPHVVAAYDAKTQAELSYALLLQDRTLDRISQDFSSAQSKTAEANLASARAVSDVNKTARELMNNGDAVSSQRAMDILSRTQNYRPSVGTSGDRLFAAAEERGRKINRAKHRADSLSVAYQTLVTGEYEKNKGKSEADLVEHELGFSVLNYITGYGEGAQVVTVVLLLLLGYLATGTIAPSRIKLTRLVEPKTAPVVITTPAAPAPVSAVSEPEPEIEQPPLARDMADYLHLLDVIHQGNAHSCVRIEQASAVVPPAKKISKSTADRMIREIMASQNPALVELRTNWRSYGRTLADIFQRAA